MFCEDCGAEIPDNATFCSQCGKKAHPLKVKKEKNMAVALIISFILVGLGMAYAGNVKKGIVFFVTGFICNILGFSMPFFRIIGIIIWIFAMYMTYVEVENANGKSDPRILEDWKGWSKEKKIGAAVVVLILFLILVGGVIGAFAPNSNSSGHVDGSSSGGVSSSGGSSSSSSSSSDTFSSSSNGRDVESHYEGEYGSSDTHGTIYDDGSVESHQTGHTDYGDYKIDSYMDSDGNLHGTVDVGGKTYHVSS